MKKSQTGFSTAMIVLLVLILAAAGFAGWKVYNSKSKKEITSSSSSNTATLDKPKLYIDTANRFTFTYPSTWTIAFPEKGGTDGPQPPDPDWTKVSRPVLVKPADGEQNNNVRVTPGCETVSSTGQTVTVLQDLKDRKDRFHTQEALSINGYDGFYDKLEFKGDAESYLDHTYFITNGKECLLFSYRENHHHDMSNTNFDDKKNVPGFKSLVESVKYLD